MDFETREELAAAGYCAEKLAVLGEALMFLGLFKDAQECFFGHGAAVLGEIIMDYTEPLKKHIAHVSNAGKDPRADEQAPKGAHAEGLLKVYEARG